MYREMQRLQHVHCTGYAGRRNYRRCKGAGGTCDEEVSSRGSGDAKGTGGTEDAGVKEEQGMQGVLGATGYPGVQEI